MKAKELSNEQIEYALGRLQQFTEVRQLTQTQLEQLSGVNQSTISKIFNGALTPSPDVLKKLFQAIGLQLTDVLYEANGVGQELLGYLATPLTGLVGDARAEAQLKDVVSRIRRAAALAEFRDPTFHLYWPGDYTHPTTNPEFTAGQVYLTDRSRASTYDFIILFCGAPSYGVGQENEIATQAGIPAIRLIPVGISRMMTGSFIRAADVTYTGTLSTQIAYDEAELASAFHAVRKIHFRHLALNKNLHGHGFGARLRKLLADRYGDYERFAEDVGIDIRYLHTLMEEPLRVANPSVTLLKRMAALLSANIAYLLGEADEADPIWVESNASWHAWVTSTPGLDGATAVRIRDGWRERFRRERNEPSAASFRKTGDVMRKTDWDKLYQKSYVQSASEDDNAKPRLF